MPIERLLVVQCGLIAEAGAGAEVGGMRNINVLSIIKQSFLKGLRASTRGNATDHRLSKISGIHLRKTYIFLGEGLLRVSTSYI